MSGECLQEDRLDRVGNVADRGLEERRLRQELEAVERRSEERFRSLVQNSHDVVAIVDESATVTYVSPGVGKVLGYEPEDLMGRVGFDFVHQDDLGRAVEVVQECLSSPREVKTAEIRGRRKDGVWIWLEVSVGNLMDVASVAGLVVNYRDITERKVAEGRLEAQGEVLRMIAQGGPLEKILSELVKSMEKLGGDVRCLVMLLDDQGKTLELVAAPSFPPELGDALARGLPVGPTGIPCSIAAHSKRLVICSDVTTDPRLEGARDLPLSLGMRSVWSFPIRSSKDDGILGTFAVYHSQPGEPTASDLETVDLAAQLAAIAIESAHAGEALRTSEERFRSLVQYSRDGIAVIDREARISYMSPAVKEIGGYEPDELVGTSAVDLVHPEDVADVLEALGAIARLPGGTEALETRARHKDGGYRWLEIRAANRMDDPGVRGIVLNFNDVTERKRFQEALEESEENFRLLFASNPAPMWVYDMETLEFIAVNEAAVRKYGYTGDEFLSMRITDIRPEQDAAGFIAHLRETAGLPVQEGSQWRHRTKDGRVLEVEVSAHQFMFKNRRATLVVAHDVTDRNEAERKRVELEQQLRQAQKMESIGRLAGGIAHDFNNLLAVILNYASFLAEDIEESDPKREDLEEIKGAAERGAKLIRQLLAFSRREIIEPRVVDLNTVVSEAEKLLQRTIGEDVDLKISTQEGLWKIKADPGQLEQVLMNLVVNARDAMPDGGSLIIETANSAVDEAHAKTRPGLRPGEYAVLTVSDNGTGMTEEVRAQVFEPFFTTKARGEGTGLGLATVYGIVKRAGGYVSCYSEVGFGTTFRVYLPVTGETLDASSRGLRQTLVDGGGTILVVEDEPAVRDLVARILQRGGYEVVVAGSGSEAIGAFNSAEKKIDLLLTDVIMPEMSGKELSQRLTGDNGLRTLYMSGYTDSIVARHGVLDEGEDFIQKPFNAGELLQKVRALRDR